MKENKAAVVPARSSPAAAPTRRPSSTRTPSGSSSTTATGYIRRTSATPELKSSSDSDGQEDALDRAADSGHRRQRYRVGDSTSPATRSSRPRPCGRSSSSRPATTTARRRSARASRRRRRSTAPAATWSSPGIPNYVSATSPNPPSPRRRPALAAVPDKPAGPPIVDVTMRIQEGQAVLRQPHHVHRQHDDARQRHPARDAAVRERRLQHRGAEVQHPAAEPARLLQGARRAAQGRRRREDARTSTTRSTSG